VTKASLRRETRIMQGGPIFIVDIPSKPTHPGCLIVISPHP
jgi:hypothetical protein